MASRDDQEDAALREERLKSTLWFHLGQYIDTSLLSSPSSSTSVSNATPQFIAALTELVYTHIASTSRDLEAFAAHAGRRQISTADVLLLARRNEGLEALLRGFVEQWRAERGVDAPVAAGRGRAARARGSDGEDNDEGAGAAGAVRRRGGGAARGRGRGRARGMAAAAAGRARGRGRGRGAG
ncbi:kinetochore component CENP-S-domain-containing protein [Phyllosticta citribraziliensis]|uniref:Kinetochore component CENP-S-domain-containing protein n=1 Tax=Phyllosticta citribraziliensis TaxID=989973 RepID=A0ABR1LGY6_9PEZI